MLNHSIQPKRDCDAHTSATHSTQTTRKVSIVTGCSGGTAKVHAVYRRDAYARKKEPNMMAQPIHIASPVNASWGPFDKPGVIEYSFSLYCHSVL